MYPAHCTAAGWGPSLALHPSNLVMSSHGVSQARLILSHSAFKSSFKFCQSVQLAPEQRCPIHFEKDESHSVLVSLLLCRPSRYQKPPNSTGCQPTPPAHFAPGNFPATVPQSCSAAWGYCDTSAGHSTGPHWLSYKWPLPIDLACSVTASIPWWDKAKTRKDPISGWVFRMPGEEEWDEAMWCS